MAAAKYYLGETIDVVGENEDADGVATTANSAAWAVVDPTLNLRFDYDLVPASISAAEGSAGALTGALQYGITYTYAIVDGSNARVVTEIVESCMSPIASISVASKRVNLTIPAAPTFATTPYKKLVYTTKIWRKKEGEDWKVINNNFTLAGGSFEDNNAAGTDADPPFVNGDTVAHFKVQFKNTGLFNGLVSFAKSDGSINISPLTWEVKDPLAVNSNPTNQDVTVDLVWSWLEDCFDSTEGGPWLTETTKRILDKDKIATSFYEAALFSINNQQPFTNYNATDYPYDSAKILLAQSLLIECIKHLLRSYTEQPLVNGEVSYLDRRDYLQRWAQILDIESKAFQQNLGLFKLDQFGFGQSKIIIDPRSGRRQSMIPHMRTRYPRLWY